MVAERQYNQVDEAIRDNYDARDSNMNRLTLSIYVSEAINLAVVLYGLVYLVQRMLRLSRLSYSNRSLHVNPKYRWAFVIAFLLVNLAEFVLFFIKVFDKNQKEYWMRELFISLGTFLNATILIGGLYLLKFEITRDRKRTKLHYVYSFYLILITLVRLSQEIWTYLDKNTSDFEGEIISDAVLLGLTVMMFVYKLINRNEDDLGQFGVNELEQRLRKGSMTVYEESQENIDPFPYLKVDVVSLTTESISFSVILRQKAFQILDVSIQSLHNFHIQTQILDLQHRLDIEKKLDINDIESFVDQLLSSWQNYQVFVLEFFGIPAEMHHQWSNMVDKNKEESNFEEQFDCNSIYFSLCIPRLIKYYSNFQVLIQIETRSGRHKRQANKTTKEIKQLHKKLQSIKLKSGKSKFNLRLPPLPVLSSEIKGEEAMEEKKKEYQKYFQRLMNDRNIVKRHKEIRGLVYQFFGYNEAIQLSLRKESSINYSGLFSKKVRIKTKLDSKNEPIVLYYFEIKKYETYFKRIKKSHQDFRELDAEIRRYLHNSQTEKFVELAQFPPIPSHFLTPLEKQELHSNLNLYLNIFLSGFPDISQIYEFKVFLNIKSQEEETEENESFIEMPESPPSFSKKFSEFSLEKSNSMADDDMLSQKIDNLGNSEFDLQIH